MKSANALGLAAILGLGASGLVLPGCGEGSGPEEAVEHVEEAVDDAGDAADDAVKDAGEAVDEVVEDLDG